MYLSSYQLTPSPKSSTAGSATLALTEVVCPELPGHEQPLVSEAMAACNVCASLRGDATTEEKQEEGLHPTDHACEL